jgi:hypothetical protein
MHCFTQRAIAAFCLSLLAVCSANAADLGWSQNLQQQELIALGIHKPVVVFFIGNGRFDSSIFNSEPLQPLANQVRFAWVGSNLENQVTPDQIALEKQYRVSKFPTLLLLRAVKTGASGPSGDHYEFRESFRCVVSQPGACASAIITAVETGE